MEKKKNLISLTKEIEKEMLSVFPIDSKFIPQNLEKFSLKSNVYLNHSFIF